MRYLGGLGKGRKAKCDSGNRKRVMGGRGEKGIYVWAAVAPPVDEVAFGKI